MKKEMLINVLQPEECRIAIVENGILEELYVERTGHESYVGNIYKGRIVNIEPSIQAAFVDFGVGRNGFLHVSDVEPAYYRHLEPTRGEESRRGRDRFRGGPAMRPNDSGGGRRRREPPIDLMDFEDDEPLTQTPPAAESLLEPEPDPAVLESEPAPLEELFEEPDLPIDDEPTDELDPPAAEPDAAVALETEVAEEVVAEPTDEAVEESGTATTEEPKAAELRGKERRKRGGPRRRKGDRARTAEDGGEEATPPEAGDGGETPPERPRPMESAERRTEEGDGDPPPSPAEEEDLLFFPRPKPASKPTPPPQPAPEPVFAREEPEPAFDEEEPVTTTLPPEEDLDREEEEPDEDFDSAPPLEPVDDFDMEDEFDRDEEEPDEDFERRRPRRGRDGGRGGPRRRGGRPGGGGGGRPGMGRPKPLIQDIFKRGQEVLVQVIKEGIGTKGPTLSTYISIAGRYLVLMPGLNRIGVSRKIQDEDQRRRLRDILSELQPPKGLGFIIRTAGLDRTKRELQRDLAYLSRLWQVVVRRIRKMKAPTEIYQESDMITRTIRDTFTAEIDTIWVDEPQAFEHAQEFLQIVMPRYANRINMYSEPDPLFHKYGIENEISRIQQKHVPLPMGGSIVIEQTEALVAIDVNSGNFRADNNAEETAYQMNLQAAKEIARQLRLRDLGGVIVNDFIDMREEKHRRGVEKALRDAVKRDRARTKILRISQFGIIEMTRQRIRPSLKRSIYQDCPACKGHGQVKTSESMSIEVMRLLQLAAHRNHVHRIYVRVVDGVASYLLNRKRLEIARLEEGGKIQVTVEGVMGVPPEFLEFLCFDNNNNEVKLLPHHDEPRRRR